MAYHASAFPVWVLNRPLISACMVLLFGLGGGAIAAMIFKGMNLFERFGAVTTTLGLVVFGSLASELLVRSQGSFIMSGDGEPSAPFNFATVRHALNLQTIVVGIGTLQWGFGSLIFAR